MAPDGSILKGKRVIVEVPENSSTSCILARASEKIRCHYVQFREFEWSLHYPDGTPAVMLRENTDRPFRLDDYKHEVGKDYLKIILYMRSKDTTGLCIFTLLFQTF